MPDSLASRLIRACAAVVAKRKREGFGGRRLNNSNGFPQWTTCIRKNRGYVQVAAYNPRHLYTFVEIRARKTRQGLSRFETTYILVGTVPAFFCKTLGL